MYFDPDTAKDVTDALAENMHFYGNKLYLELPGNDPYDSGKYNDKKYVVQYTTTFKPEKDIQTRVLFGTTYINMEIRRLGQIHIIGITRTVYIVLCRKLQVVK